MQSSKVPCLPGMEDWLRGIISYHYVPRGAPAASAEAPTAVSSAAQDAWLRQQKAEAEEHRRDLLAYQDLRRQREDQWRRERQELDAYGAARQSIVREGRLEHQARPAWARRLSQSPTRAARDSIAAR